MFADVLRSKQPSYTVKTHAFTISVLPGLASAQRKCSLWRRSSFQFISPNFYVAASVSATGEPTLYASWF